MTFHGEQLKVRMAYLMLFRLSDRESKVGVEGACGVVTTRCGVCEVLDSSRGTPGSTKMEEENEHCRSKEHSGGCGLSNSARKNMMGARHERHRSNEHGGGRWQRRMSDDSKGQGESGKMDEQWLSRGYGVGAGRALSLRVRSYHST